MCLGHQSRHKPHQTDPRTIAHTPTMVLVWLTVHEPGRSLSLGNTLPLLFLLLITIAMGALSAPCRPGRGPS